MRKQEKISKKSIKIANIHTFMLFFNVFFIFNLSNLAQMMCYIHHFSSNSIGYKILNHILYKIRIVISFVIL